MQLEDDLVQRLVLTSTLEQTGGTQIWDSLAHINVECFNHESPD